MIYLQGDFSGMFYSTKKKVYWIEDRLGSGPQKIKVLKSHPNGYKTMLSIDTASNSNLKDEIKRVLGNSNSEIRRFLQWQLA